MNDDGRRVNDARVAAEIIGLDEDSARARVEAFGLDWRVVTRDGVGIMHHADLRFDRVSVKVTSGVVTGAKVA